MDCKCNDMRQTFHKALEILNCHENHSFDIVRNAHCVLPDKALRELSNFEMRIFTSKAAGCFCFLISTFSHKSLVMIGIPLGFLSFKLPWAFLKRFNGILCLFHQK